MAINKELYFDDLKEFWNYAMRESEARVKSSRERMSSAYNGWAGVSTWDEAKYLALCGWREGLQEVDKYNARIVPRITDRVLRPQQVYGVAGYCVDVGAFLASDPECFITKEYGDRNYPGRILKVVVSVSFSAAIQPKTIIQRGAMICALVDAAEFAGHRVEVVCNDASSVSTSEVHRQGLCKERGWFEVSVVVKKPSHPLDMSAMAFCLAHPAMLRRMMFSVAELEGWSDFVSNYGYPAAATDQGDIYLPEVFSGIVSDERAIDWVFAELEKLGVSIEQRS